MTNARSGHALGAAGVHEASGPREGEGDLQGGWIARNGEREGGMVWLGLVWVLVGDRVVGVVERRSFKVGGSFCSVGFVWLAVVVGWWWSISYRLLQGGLATNFLVGAMSRGHVNDCACDGKGQCWWMAF